jgi:hypothetical protein
MPPVIDNRGGNGKRFYQIGTGWYRPGSSKKVQWRVSKLSLNKNVWKIDTEAGTYQDRGCNHDPL